MQVSTLSIDGVPVARAETRTVQRLLTMAAAGLGELRSTHMTCKRPDTVWADGKVVRSTDPMEVTLNLVFENREFASTLPPRQWIPLTPAIMAGLRNDDPVWVRTKEGETWLMTYDATNDHFDSRSGWMGLPDITHIQLIPRPEAP